MGCHLLVSAISKPKRIRRHEGGLVYSLPSIQSEIFDLWDMDKNTWEQISAALQGRETSEPLNTTAALSALISSKNTGPLLSCCSFFLENYLKVFQNTFKVFCLTITFPSSTKNHQNINLIIWGKILTYVDNFLSNAHI